MQNKNALNVPQTNRCPSGSGRPILETLFSPLVQGVRKGAFFFFYSISQMIFMFGDLCCWYFSRCAEVVSLGVSREVSVGVTVKTMPNPHLPSHLLWTCIWSKVWLVIPYFKGLGLKRPMDSAAVLYIYVGYIDDSAAALHICSV